MVVVYGCGGVHAVILDLKKRIKKCFVQIAEGYCLIAKVGDIIVGIADIRMKEILKMTCPECGHTMEKDKHGCYVCSYCGYSYPCPLK